MARADSTATDSAGSSAEISASTFAAARARRTRGARPPFQGSGLQQALEKDHDGSILDNLAGYLGGTAQLSPRTTNGAGILDHVLGDKQETLARGISAKSGLDIGSVANLLTLRAPIVLGVLGKK